MHRKQALVSALGALAALAGAPLACAREAALPEIAVPARFEAADHADGALPPPAQGWWQVFADPQLDALIGRMHAGNTTIAQSAARLAAARAQARMGKASQMPELGLTASASHAGGPLVNEAGTSGSLFTARATISWEADLLGKLSSERRAERLDARVAEAMLADTRLLMEAETADAYFQVRYLDEASAEATRRSALFDEAAAIATGRFGRGLTDRPVLNHAIQQQDEARRSAGQIAQARDSARRRLGFLLGETATPVLEPGTLPLAPVIPAGLPSEMLARRPDIAAAVARLEASDSRLRAARKSWLPSFALTASGGAASPSLGQLLASSARDFGLSALLSLPLFDGGRRKAAIAGRRAEVDLAAAQYRESVLVSLREVNDGLGGAQSLATGLDLAMDRLAQSEAAGRIAASRAASGLSSRASVLEAEQKTSDMRLEVLAGRQGQLSGIVGLIKAMGGGW